MEIREITFDQMMEWLTEKRKAIYNFDRILPESERNEVDMIIAVREAVRELQSLYKSMSERMERRKRSVAVRGE
jgi:predicted oxidoreductase (fatty acid repression mutant protein)